MSSNLGTNNIRVQRELPEIEPLAEVEEAMQQQQSERMPGYAREYFDQQLHQDNAQEQIVEPPYQVRRQQNNSL